MAMSAVNKEIIATLAFVETFKEEILRVEEIIENTATALETRLLPGLQRKLDFYLQRAEQLSQTYNSVCHELKEIAGIKANHALLPVHVSNPKSEAAWATSLKSITMELNRAAAALRSILSNLPPEKELELKRLKESANQIVADLPNDFEVNINEAIGTLESGKYLGAALTAARIISYVLDQIDGPSIDEKVKTLKRAGLVQEESEAKAVVKADKLARNYYSHDLKAMPSVENALELVSAAVRIIKVYANYRSQKKD